MNKEFVTYEIDVILKELGFNEPCLAFWNGNINSKFIHMVNQKPDDEHIKYIINSNTNLIVAPLWQQVIDWFREKHKISIAVLPHKFEDNDGLTNTLWFNCVTDISVNYPILMNESDLNASDYNCVEYYEALKEGILKGIKMLKTSKELQDNDVLPLVIERLNIDIPYTYGKLKKIEFTTTSKGKVIHSWLILHGLRTGAGNEPFKIHLGRKVNE
jgi:hypothetical protein